MRLKIKLVNLFYYIFLILPIIDSLNGIINDGGNEQGISIGIIYRFFVILLCFFFVTSYGLSKRMILISFVGIFIYVIPAIYHISNANLILTNILKLFLPIIVIETFRILDNIGLIPENMIENIIYRWGFLFPITIILPYIFNLGFNTYGSEKIGYKGYYFAQNDIGFIMAILFIYAINKILKQYNIRNIIMLILILLCNLVLGLKSNYLIIIFVTIYYVGKNMKNKAAIGKKILLLLIIVIGIFSIYIIFNEQIQLIFTRWNYFRTTNSNVISFLSSTRTDRILPAISYLNENHGFSWILFGSDIRNTRNLLIEMDVFDILFQYGLIGCILLYTYYLKIIILNWKKIKNQNFLNLAFVMSFVISTLSGHVMESALSAMFFAIICSGILSRERNKNFSNTV